MEAKDSPDSVVIVVTDKNKILLIKRSKTDEWMPLHWSFPGGHIEVGEPPYKAAKRELKEETNLDGKITYAGLRKTKTGKMYIYLCDEFKNDVELNYEHCDHKWVEYKDIDDLEDKTPYVKQIIATALEIPMGYE
jgi:mutator protein MutT